MSVRSRRAEAPVSSSASTTILPLTRCRPPAKRSIVATSALRQHVLVIWVFASSAFTCAVIAMRPILPRASITLGQNPGVRRGQLAWVVAGRPITDRDVVDDQPGTGGFDQVAELGQLVGHGLAIGEHGVHLQVGGVLGQ